MEWERKTIKESEKKERGDKEKGRSGGGRKERRRKKGRKEMKETTIQIRKCIKMNKKRW